MKKEQKELSVLVDRVRERTPLIHNITNYVTVNDCANILLACGGSPIMSDELQEVEEITSICGGLHINIGTLNQRTIPAMKAACLLYTSFIRVYAIAILSFQAE